MATRSSFGYHQALTYLDFKCEMAQYNKDPTKKSIEWKSISSWWHKPVLRWLTDRCRRTHPSVVCSPGVSRKATVVTRGWLLDTVATYTIQNFRTYRADLRAAWPPILAPFNPQLWVAVVLLATSFTASVLLANYNLRLSCYAKSCA